MTAPETTTRSCKGCANFQWAGDSPRAKFRYQAYLDAQRMYEDATREPEGFWAKLFWALPGPPALYPFPPFPQLNPETFGWCRLHPTTVEKGVNEWCSHFRPTQSTLTDGEE